MHHKLIQVHSSVVRFNQEADFGQVLKSIDRAFAQTLESLSQGDIKTAVDRLNNVISANEILYQRMGDSLYHEEMPQTLANVSAYNYGLDKLSKLYAFRMMISLAGDTPTPSQTLTDLIDTFFSYNQGIHLPEILSLPKTDKAQVKSDKEKLVLLQKAAEAQPYKTLTLGGDDEHNDPQWRKGSIRIFVPDYAYLPGIASFRSMWEDVEFYVKPLLDVYSMLTLPGHHGRILDALQKGFHEGAQRQHRVWTDRVDVEQRLGASVPAETILSWADSYKASNLANLMAEISQGSLRPEALTSKQNILSALVRDTAEGIAVFAGLLQPLLDRYQQNQMPHVDPAEVKQVFAQYLSTGQIPDHSSLYGLENPSDMPHLQQMLLLRINFRLAGLDETFWLAESIPSNLATLNHLLSFVQRAIFYSGSQDYTDRTGQFRPVVETIQTLHNSKLRQYREDLAVIFSPSEADRSPSLPTPQELASKMLETFYLYNGYHQDFIQLDVLDAIELRLQRAIEHQGTAAAHLLVDPAAIAGLREFVGSLLLLSHTPDSSLPVSPEIAQKSLVLLQQLQQMMESPGYDQLVSTWRTMHDNP